MISIHEMDMERERESDLRMTATTMWLDGRIPTDEGPPQGTGAPKRFKWVFNKPLWLTMVNNGQWLIMIKNDHKLVDKPFNHGYIYPSWSLP